MCYHQFVIRVQQQDGQRDELRDYLRARGIPTEIYYPAPLHLQPAFAYLGYGAGAFPQAEEASRQVLALPIFPQMTEEQQKLVVKTIAEFFDRTISQNGCRGNCFHHRGHRGIVFKNLCDTLCPLW